MPTFTRALLIGVDQHGCVACEDDARRWEGLLGALAVPQITTLLGAGATGAAALAALGDLAAGVAADRAADPTATGFFGYFGVGWSDGRRSGVCLADAEPAWDDLVAELDRGMPRLARARDAAAARPAPVLDVRLPAPGLLAVLDTAVAAGPAPPGATSRARPGAAAAEALASALGADASQPRLGYHARQIAPQTACWSWESDASGVRQGEITRWFAPWFAEHHAAMEVFGQEIGPGTDGFTLYAVERPDGRPLGTAAWTFAQPAAIGRLRVPRQTALWHLEQLPADFVLRRLRGPPPGWPTQRLYLRAASAPFAPARQGDPPPADVVYAMRASPGGALLGYMGLSDPAAPTRQWWSSPFGMVDNHGFLVHHGDIRFTRVTVRPAIEGDWRTALTLQAAPTRR